MCVFICIFIYESYFLSMYFCDVCVRKCVNIFVRENVCMYVCVCVLVSVCVSVGFQF